MRPRSSLAPLVLALLSGIACDEDSGSAEPAAAEPAPESAEATGPDPSETAAGPTEAPLDDPPAAAADFEPPCLGVATVERGDATIPQQLADLAAETHGDSSLVRVFARKGRVPPTAAGHEPTGHLFRWTLREAIADPRERFPNDQFRGRLAGIAAGVPLREGFENRQVRTIEARLRTQGPLEQVMTVLNSKAEGRPSTVSQSCVDHGPLPGLTVAHFARWGWWPPALAALTEQIPDARVHRLRTDPAEVVLSGDASLDGALRGAGWSVSRRDDGTFRVVASGAPASP